jgi:glycerol-3-phosphate acyltransferase PlsY
MMYWTDVVSLSGTAAGVAAIALFVFLFGWNWDALGAGVVTFVVVCVAIVVILRIADQRDRGMRLREPEVGPAAELIRCWDQERSARD